MTPDRLERELELLKGSFEQVEYDQNGACVLLRNVPLLPGWDRTSIDVLVLIPTGYPATPPDNFFVPVGLKLISGQPPSNYSESQALIGSLWGQFSFHAQEWNPSAKVEEGDNLLTFLLLARQRLAEVN